ncbi:MAG: hypothetical protein WA373_09470 [Burkholderiales bacterium]
MLEGTANNVPGSVAEIESFITMLRVACEDASVNARLEKLLSLPDHERRGLVHTWVSDMLIARAPQDFVAAIACLSDDRIAEKAYEVIFKCRRGDAL